MAKGPEVAEWPKPRGFGENDREMLTHVWDDVRTARMNELYYGKKIARWSPWNVGSEILIALTSSGSIAGWALWKNDQLSWIWAVLAGIAAVVAVIRPVVGLDRIVRAAAQQQQRYRSVLNSLESLVIDIQKAGEVTDEHNRRYQKARDILNEAFAADDASANSDRLKWSQEQVNKEMPPESLWLPKFGGPLQAS
jgi:hypothetical protein